MDVYSLGPFQLMQAILGETVLEIFLAGKEERCFSYKRRVAADETVLCCLFRDYLRAKLPPGCAPKKIRHRSEYEVYFNFAADSFQQTVDQIRSRESAWQEQSLDTVGLWLLERKLVRCYDRLAAWRDTELPGVRYWTSSTHRLPVPPFFIDLRTLLLSPESVSQPVIAINTLAGFIGDVYQAAKAHEDYSRLLSRSRLSSSPAAPEPSIEEAVQALREAAQQALLGSGYAGNL